MDEWNEWAGSAAADSGHWTASRQADNLTACLTAHTQPEPGQLQQEATSPVQDKTGQETNQGWGAKTLGTWTVSD